MHDGSRRGKLLEGQAQALRLLANEKFFEEEKVLAKIVAARTFSSMVGRPLAGGELSNKAHREEKEGRTAPGQ